MTLKKQHFAINQIETILFRTFGHFNSHGILAMTSTASAPPTPIQSPPKPPPFGV
jgi:hypothetical protein